MFKYSVKFSNYLSNLWTNISSIKQIVYQPKIFGIWSLFIPFCLISHWIVDTAYAYSQLLDYTVVACQDKRSSLFSWDIVDKEKSVFITLTPDPLTDASAFEEGLRWLDDRRSLKRNRGWREKAGNTYWMGMGKYRWPPQ